MNMSNCQRNALVTVTGATRGSLLTFNQSTRAPRPQSTSHAHPGSSGTPDKAVPLIRILPPSRIGQVGEALTWAKEYMRLVLSERGADHAWMTTGPWPSSPSGADDPIRPRLVGGAERVI